MARNTTPYVSVTGTVGGVTTTRRIPVETQSNGQPYPVSLTPDAAFPDAIVIGASEQRNDQRTAQVIFNGFPGGVGEDEYSETEGISTARDSTLDTRYDHSLVLPPGVTQLGSALTAGNMQRGITGLQLPQSFVDHRYYLYGGANAFAYNATTNSWGVGLGRMLAALVKDEFLFTLSTAGTNMVARTASFTSGTNNATLTDPPAGGGSGSFVAMAEFDNRLWVARLWQGGEIRVYYTTDHLSTATLGVVTATWTQATSMKNGMLAYGTVNPIRLFVWRYPPASSYPALWMQTGNRLFFYDEPSGANVWKEWATLGPLWPGQDTDGNPLGLRVWPRNNNLYTVPQERKQQIKEWTGSTEDLLGPNERGGLPTGSHTYFYTLDANGRYLVAFGDNAMPWDGRAGTVGRVWAMDEGRGFHNVYAEAGPVWGGWVGNDTLCVVTGTTGIVYEIPFSDERTLPRNATNRTYRTGATYALETADTDGGTPYVPKRAVRVTLDSRDANNQPAVPTNTTVGIDYAIDGATSWTVLADFTPGQAIPAQVAFPNGGVRFYRIRFRIRMSSSNVVATPNVPMWTLHFLRRPKRRYARTFRFDLRDNAPAFRNASKRFGSYSAANLRAWLQAVADGQATEADSPLVSLAYGGRGNSLHPARVTVSAADVVLNPIEDPDSGLGRVSATFRDLSTPTSGV